MTEILSHRYMGLAKNMPPLINVILLIMNINIHKYLAQIIRPCYLLTAVLSLRLSVCLSHLWSTPK